MRKEPKGNNPTTEAEILDIVDCLRINQYFINICSSVCGVGASGIESSSLLYTNCRQSQVQLVSPQTLDKHCKGE